MSFEGIDDETAAELSARVSRLEVLQELRTKTEDDPPKWAQILLAFSTYGAIGFIIFYLILIGHGVAEIERYLGISK